MTLQDSAPSRHLGRFIRMVGIAQPDTLFTDTSCRIKSYDLSIAYANPAFATFQLLTTSSPIEPCSSDLAFSYISPPVGRNSADATSGTDEKTIATRLSEENGSKDNCDDNHQNRGGAPAARQAVKLRSASRKPKRFRYRTRLNLRFDKLLTVLQASRREDERPGEAKSLETNYCFSRGDVLDAARQRILALEEENKQLSCKIKELSQALMVG
ncbi:hypothetical protein QL093DRAFT_2591136 [Fusarium oxysporum]|nr:hypothetical protein QL093DRAFT_2591136 [Fusarium oxysporum]